MCFMVLLHFVDPGGIRLESRQTGFNKENPQRRGDEPAPELLLVFQFGVAFLAAPLSGLLILLLRRLFSQAQPEAFQLRNVARKRTDEAEITAIRKQTQELKERFN